MSFSTFLANFMLNGLGIAEIQLLHLVQQICIFVKLLHSLCSLKNYSSDLHKIIRNCALWGRKNNPGVLHVTSCHVMSCHVMSRHIASCCVISRHVASCHVTSCHVRSRHVMSRNDTSCHVMSRHVTSCYFMLRHVTSCYVM